MNSDPPPPTKNRISFFFKQKETANSANSSLTTNTSSVTICREIVMKSSEPTHNISSTITSVNACLAIENREKILSEREIKILKNVFMEIEVSYEQLFTSDVKNDQQLMQIFTTFIHKWDVFKNLREEYHGAQQRNSRKSGIKLKINNIEEAVDKLKQVMIEICNIPVQIEGLVGSTFQLSQSYLKKSEALTSLLASLGVLKNMVPDSTLLNDLRRRLKQQNDSVNNPFV